MWPMSCRIGARRSRRRRASLFTPERPRPRRSHGFDVAGDVPAPVAAAEIMIDYVPRHIAVVNRPGPDDSSQVTVTLVAICNRWSAAPRREGIVDGAEHEGGVPADAKRPGHAGHDQFRSGPVDVRIERGEEM